MARSSCAPTRWRRIVRRGSLVMAAGTGAVALLAGCGSSQLAQTSEIKPAIQGVDANSTDRTIALRNLLVLFRGDQHRSYAAGSTVPLEVRIASTGNQPDTLTSVTSPDAEHVVLVKAGASAAPTGSPTATGSPTGTASPTGSASPSPTSTTTPPGRTTFRVQVPSMGLVQLVPPGSGAQPTAEYLALAGLKPAAAPLTPGGTVHVVFHFLHAGNVPVDIPLNVPSGTAVQHGKPTVSSGS